jgi:hypothetical protein
MPEVQKTTQSGEMSQRFIEFVLMHAQHAALCLGQIPNPGTGQPEVNLDLARLFIDQLEMIQEKTRGNLSSDETAVLRNTLANLQMAYVEAASGKTERAAQPTAPGPAAQPQGESVSSPESAKPEAVPQPEPESRKKFTKSYGP